MKIICSKANLVKGVSIVSKAVPSRTTMPILECILIDASANEIKLTANDMELGIETVIEGEIVERGIIALDAKFFSEIVRKLPYIEKNESITISQFTLKDVVRQTIFSIADNDTNKLMTGELFEINENRLRVVSLDGHRISIRNIELKENYSPLKVVVPGKTLQEISKILTGEAEDMVDIYFADNHILFEFDQTKVVSRLIEGEYFHIDQMLSSDYDTKVKVNKREFLSCIDRATLLIREGDKKPIILNIQDGSLQLKINSFAGSMNEELEIDKEGKDLLIGFNPRFFIDALRAIDDEEVTLYMVNPKAPCFIKDDAGTYVYLILPVNFNAATV